MKQFDYEKSVAELEAMIAKAEDPQTGIFEAEKLIEKGRKVLKECYDYLRSEREKEI